MRILLRRLRGIAGLALIWSAGWACFGALLGFLQTRVMSEGHPELRSALGELVLIGALMSGVYGLVMGTVFGCILALAERNRRIEQLRNWRIAAWGAIGGAVVPLAIALAVGGGNDTVLRDSAVVMSMSSVLGAISAVATLNVARNPSLSAESRATGRPSK